MNKQLITRVLLPLLISGTATESFSQSDAKQSIFLCHDTLRFHQVPSELVYHSSLDSMVPTQFPKWLMHKGADGRVYWHQRPGSVDDSFVNYVPQNIYRDTPPLPFFTVEVRKGNFYYKTIDGNILLALSFNRKKRKQRLPRVLQIYNVGFAFKYSKDTTLQFGTTKVETHKFEYRPDGWHYGNGLVAGFDYYFEVASKLPVLRAEYLIVDPPADARKPYAPYNIVAFVTPFPEAFQVDPELRTARWKQF